MRKANNNRKFDKPVGSKNEFPGFEIESKFQLLELDSKHILYDIKKD